MSTANGPRRIAPPQSGFVKPGAENDRIWNGADDDGSGTVAMMALAKAFAEGPRPKRSLLFVWHAGEERGRYGSLFFADALTPYEILGLTPGTTDAEVKARYRQLVRDTHPDRLIGRGLSADFIAAAERRLAAINEAYDTIIRERVS